MTKVKQHTIQQIEVFRPVQTKGLLLSDLAVGNFLVPISMYFFPFQCLCEDSVIWTGNSTFCSGQMQQGHLRRGSLKACGE